MPTVLEDVAFGPLNHGLPPKDAAERAKRALSQVGMSEMSGKAPYHLSAGEKKRVAIAGILAMDPEILVLDEPTTFLDPPGQRALAQLLSALPQAKVLITHDMPFARAMCSRAAFFQNGRIIEEGSVELVARRHDWDFMAPRIT
jgi:cobalt/nickel transport system ATP-binding protein